MSLPRPVCRNVGKNAAGRRTYDDDDRNMSVTEGSFSAAAAVDGSGDDEYADPRDAEIVGRRVHCPRHMAAWERSEALADVTAFVGRMNAAAAAAETRPPAVTVAVDAVAAVLRRVGEWAAIGPQSFAEFHARLRALGRPLLVGAFARGRDHRVTELPAYLEASFGDPMAGAYGPEHELSFAMFLVALFKLGRLGCADEPYVVSVLFDSYTDVVDSLIRCFRLTPSSEPDGGSLDGFRFLGFVWGSAQLMDGRDPSPAAWVDGRGRGGVFAKCVDAVNRRREAADDDRDARPPLWVHSYWLWNLTAASRWDLVNRRLVAAYRRHVLGRFRVVRRLLFGQLLRFSPNPRPPGVSFYDCVPAAAATIAVPAAVVTDDVRGGQRYHRRDRLPKREVSREEAEEFE